MTIEAALRRTMAELSRATCPFALVGGLAVSARTEPRFTRDVETPSQSSPPAASTEAAISPRHSTTCCARDPPSVAGRTVRQLARRNC